MISKPKEVRKPNEFMTREDLQPTPTSRCLLIHWPTLDWEKIKPILEEGQLPALNSLVERGLMGELSSVAPPIPAIQSNSLITGHRADHHGILSSHQLDELSGELTPVGSLQRRTPSLWNICSRGNLPSIWVHWPYSHPAEPILGVNISNMFATSVAPFDAPWPIPEQSIASSGVSSNFDPEMLSDLRIHFGELSSQELAPLLPAVKNWAELDDPKLAPLADAIATTASIHAIATDLIENEDWKVAGIHYPGLETIGLLFPDPCAWNDLTTQPSTNLWYEGVLRNVYRWHDMMLGRLLELAGEQTMIVLVSERGAVIQNKPAAFAHNGSILLAGPTILEDELIHGAHTLDVVPTILAALGLPVGKDMPGKVLLQAFRAPPTINYINSWEDVPDTLNPNPTSPTHSDSDAADEETAQALRELIALGYQEFIPQQSETAVQLQLQQQINLYQVQMDSGSYHQASQTLEKLCEAIPKNPWLRLAHAMCLMNIGESVQARNILEALLEQPAPNSVSHLLLGLLATHENNSIEALEHLREASKEHAHWPELHRRIGWLLTRLGKHDEAKTAFLESLKLAPQLASSRLGLANVAMHQGQLEAAIDHALAAIQSKFHWPNAHALLGIILIQSRRFEDAERALLVSLSQQPNHLAHTWLAKLYRELIQDETKASYHQQQAEALLKQKSLSTGSKDVS